MKGRVRRRTCAWLLVPMLASWPAGGVSGQVGQPAAGLQAVEAAMVEGDFDRARDLVEAWSDGPEAGADRRAQQHVLWLRAVLTVDPDGAELLYRRLVLEHPGGEWSDQALLRLAQGAEARNEPDVAARYLQILVRDYPASPHRLGARAHLARLERGESAAAPPAAPSPATPRATEPTPVATAVVASDGAYTVQLGAFGTRERAESYAAELRLAGMEVRVIQVEGSPLFRVRTGAFDVREAAEARADELDARGFEAFVSADRDRERPVG